MSNDLTLDICITYVDGDENEYEIWATAGWERANERWYEEDLIIQSSDPLLPDEHPELEKIKSDLWVEANDQFTGLTLEGNSHVCR